MMDQNKNKGENNAFDDDEFDVEEFSDADFADAEFDESEYAADGELDAEFDEEYADEEWQEESAPVAPKKQRSSSKKGLSFNTIVILGAVVVGGGVMMMTMMSKSSQQQQSISDGGIFQSILSIANVMDGTLFGSNEEVSGEQVVTPEQQQSQQGFLDNPDSINNPPQPTPIAPSENEVLTPMPDVATDNVPRAPEETPLDNENVAVVAPIAPQPTPEAEPAQPKAEDILKQAMANRERKAQGLVEEQEPPKVEAPIVPPVAEVKTPEPLEIAKVETTSTPVASPAPIVPDISKQELEAKAKEIEELQKRLDEATKNTQKLETELSNARAEKDSNADQVSSLKKEVAELKSRPVPASEKKEAAPKPEPVEEKVAEIAPAPKKATPAKAKPKKVETSVYPSQSPEVSAAARSRWELRAAQPGRAWVSKPGARDMQSVEVGQTLAGIGRVTAISFTNGRWAVTGTQGQILQ